VRQPTLSDTVWTDALTVAVFTSGMGPLLGWWAERRVLDTDDDARALLAVQLAHGRKRANRLQGALQETSSVLQRAGLSLALLKGTHTAHYCFPEPGVRPMSDLDVLVEAEAVTRAESALRAAGYSLDEASRVDRPYRSTWRPPGALATVRSLLVHHAENPLTVDLHTSLDLDFVGVHTVHWPLQRAGWIAAPWAGSCAFVLPQPLLVAFHAAHASLTLQNLTMLRLTELALLLRRDAERVFGWHELRELVGRAGAERFVYPAFELVERFVPGTVEPELRELLTRAATPALRAVVSRVTAATAQRPGMSLDEMFMWGASPLDHVRRAAYTLLPPTARSPRSLRRLYTNRVLRLLSWRLAS
jgi:hypothetical protein